jgi:HSP20 family molecular chaperone IbpA
MKEQSPPQRPEAATQVKLVTPDILLNLKNEIQNMIARRAYELFESRGFAHGHDVDDWIEAELELLHPYRHDLQESVEAIVFRADLPGSFAADQLNVSVEPRRLIISGERELAVTCVGDGPTHAEKRTQRIFGVEELRVDVDPSRSMAKLKGEIFEIVMPKVAAANKPSRKSKAASSGR